MSLPDGAGRFPASRRFRQHWYYTFHRTKRAKQLRDILDVLGNRRAVLARELTKVYEEFRPGSLSELLTGVETEPPKGELTLVVEGATEEEPDASEATSYAGRRLEEGVGGKTLQGELMERFSMKKTEA